MSDNEAECQDEGAKERPIISSSPIKEHTIPEAARTGKENGAENLNTKTSEILEPLSSTQITEQNQRQEVREKREPGQPTAAVPATHAPILDPSEWICIDFVENERICLPYTNVARLHDLTQKK